MSKEALDIQEITWLIEQAIFFNHAWKDSQDDPVLVEYSHLMRISKDSCQLQLLKFASREQVWLRRDTDSAGQEWLIGARALPELMAAHCPDAVLKQLPQSRLDYWGISFK
jgi:hypothetical protein